MQGEFDSGLTLQWQFAKTICLHTNLFIFYMYIVPVIICKNRISWTAYSQSLAYSKLKYFYHAPNLLN
jgi:hypothetical protein